MKRLLVCLLLLMLLTTVGCDDQPFDMTFKEIPAGTFMMGSPETEEGRLDNETQQGKKAAELDVAMRPTR